MEKKENEGETLHSKSLKLFIFPSFLPRLSLCERPPPFLPRSTFILLFTAIICSVFIVFPALIDYVWLPDSLPATVITDRWESVCVCVCADACIMCVWVFQHSAHIWVNLCDCGSLPPHCCVCTNEIACMHIPLVYICVCTLVGISVCTVCVSCKNSSLSIAVHFIPISCWNQNSLLPPSSLFIQTWILKYLW